MSRKERGSIVVLGVEWLLREVGDPGLILANAKSQNDFPHNHFRDKFFLDMRQVFLSLSFSVQHAKSRKILLSFFSLPLELCVQVVHESNLSLSDSMHHSLQLVKKYSTEISYIKTR